MNHPCFDKGAHNSFARMHLPVARACNIQCGFCDRRFNCVNESRPGVTSKVISPEEALDLALLASRRIPNLKVAGIAGPGDPLANPLETISTLKLIHENLPHLMLCLSTNGLELPGYIDILADLGVRHLTVTVNAVDPLIGAKIYLGVHHKEEILSGEEAATILLQRQIEGISRAKRAGLTVKVNMVIVPGINHGHSGEVARCMSREGVDLMNCIPLAPVPGTLLGEIEQPSPGFMHEIRVDAEKWLPQMRHCARCRADALGMLGEKWILDDLSKPCQIRERAFPQ